MESSWDKLVPRTSYHFDPFKIDPAYDAMRYAGRFTGDWSEELAQTITSSEEITWRNRNPKDGTSKAQQACMGTNVTIEGTQNKGARD